MSNADLERQITTLMDSLSSTPSIDTAARVRLLELQHLISRLIDHESSVGERLEALAVRFEADHPAAGTALRQAIDALAKAGI